MSAVERWKEVFRALRDILLGLAGWTLVAPFAALVPRRRDWIAVIGREDGKFLDNTKYFLIETTSAAGQLRTVAVTERADVHLQLSGAGYPVLRYPSLPALWFLLRCGTVIVDSIEWAGRGRRFLLVRARLVQLWHGVGFKRIELDKWRNEAASRGWMSGKWIFRARLARKFFTGRIPRYDAVVTTSSFYRENVFGPAFRARHVITTGYPRNCFGKVAEAGAAAVRLNVDTALVERAHQWRAEGRRIVLVAPTFRDTRATPMGLDPATLERVDRFCAANGCELLFKFHPYERGAASIVGHHLHILEATSDVYPLLPCIDVMVTDYSSIYMDFLLLDRPVLFLTPDLDEYISRDRSIQFDFDTMTPGPKLASWDELLEALAASPAAGWEGERSRLRNLAFDDQPSGGATARLLGFMGSRGWIPPSASSEREMGAANAVHDRAT